MNETQCSELIESVLWTDPKNLVSLAILGFIDVLVVVGNCLVIAAVFCSQKLRSVTNFFIVSLAVADLLVGLAVLPFSATWEVFKVWIFGDVWCRIWLATDVLLCTASILNLCAISLDRYVAVTRPVTYPSIMSTRRAKSLIAGLWVLSFVICFPPLLGWNSSSSNEEKIAMADELVYQHENITFLSATMPPKTTYVKCPWTCELTNDAGYVVYSALGSFYIPMFVMLFFYWRIYRAAIRTTRAINQGFRTTKGKCVKNNQVDEENVTLRIHRGNKSNNHRSDLPISSSTSNLDTLRANQSSSASNFERKRRFGSSRCREKVMISVSYPSNEHIPSPTISSSSNQVATCVKEPISLKKSNSSDCSNFFKDGRTKTESLTNNNLHKKASKRSSSGVKVQVRKFRMETKAAKTLAIIVGIGSRFDEQRLTLRIHRGRGSNYNDPTHNSNGSTTTSLGSASPERLSRFSTRKHEKVKISVSYPSNENISSSAANSQSANQLFAVHYTVNGKDSQASHLFRGNSSRRSSNNSTKDFLSVSTDKLSSPRASKKMGKRNIKAQVKKFRMETKAAKTLAIIVGLFILCWLPFFTFYIISPFCDNCINKLLFSVVFWIGYCNSAINPMIYALFSKDFRFAFKRIICKCFCSGKSIFMSASRRGSDMSAIRTTSSGQRTPSLSPSHLAQSIGEDSELGCENEILR